MAGEPSVIVMIRDTAARTPSTVVLRQTYGLSEREAELAAALQQGADLAHAAEALQISHNTAKTHLKAIFLKTGTRSQSQLARLLAGVPPHPFA
ncbi:MAG: helix-turn-helix transcriptional regulator [Methyloceanibacter sp.]|uniref:helix-turn-helix transcriptional regulator n=1 Tax=Methyloceanibacter sp. TaxID=1965321 RepID=UPI003D6CB45A